MKKSILLLFILLIPVLAHAQTAEEYFNKGLEKGKKGDYRGAIQDFNKAIQLNPNLADVYNYRGLAKGLLDDLRGAIQDFNKAIQLNPNFALAYYKRGNAKIKLGQKDSGCLDLLNKGDLTESEKKQVKNASRSLLDTLKKSKLVLDWRKRQQSRADVQVTIETVLDKELPRTYTPEIFKEKCDEVFHHVYDSYYGAGRSVYEVQIQF